MPASQLHTPPASSADTSAPSMPSHSRQHGARMLAEAAAPDRRSPSACGRSGAGCRYGAPRPSRGAAGRRAPRASPGADRRAARSPCRPATPIRRPPGAAGPRRRRRARASRPPPRSSMRVARARRPSSVASSGSSGKPSTRAQRCPLVVVATAIASQRSSPAAGIDAVRACPLDRVSVLPRGPSGARALQVDLAHEVRRRLRLRHLDALALAGAAPVLERRQDARDAELGREVVRVVQGRAAGVGRVGVVPQPRESGERRVEGTVGRRLAERPVPAEGLRRVVDDVRAAGAHVLVVESPALPPRRPGCSRSRCRPPRRARGPARGRAPCAGRARRSRWPRDASLNCSDRFGCLGLDRHAPQEVEVGARLDLDHVRAQLGEEPAGLRNRDADAEVDDADAREHGAIAGRTRRRPRRRARVGKDASARSGPAPGDAAPSASPRS